MNIKKATVEDFDSLYEIGLATPELKVSADVDFMDKDEFLSAIENPNGVFLVAELEDENIGFIYASWHDSALELNKHWACLIYLAVRPEYRHLGIAQELHDSCVKDLKEHSITHLYSWANFESDGSIIKFMKKNDFKEGHKYVWMDKKI